MLLDGYSNITKEDEVLVEKLVDKVMDLLDAIIKGKIGDVNSRFEEYAKKQFKTYTNEDINEKFRKVESSQRKQSDTILNQLQKKMEQGASEKEIQDLENQFIDSYV